MNQRSELAPEIGGQVVDFYATRNAAEFAREGWEVTHPERRYEVRDGDSRWASKGGRWLVLLVEAVPA